MHEFQLRVSTEIQEAPGVTRVRHAGDVVFVATDRIKRDKWMEILCVMADPRPRFDATGRRLPSHREIYEGATTDIRQSLGRTWDLAKEHWEPTLRATWSEWQRMENLKERGEAREALVTHLEGTGIRSALGKDPTGTVDLMDTWLWQGERKNSVIVVSDAVEESVATAMMATSLEIEAGKTMLRSVTYVDWELDLGLTEAKKSRLRDPAEAVHPDFTVPLQATKFRNSVDARDVAAVRAALRAGRSPLAELQRIR